MYLTLSWFAPSQYFPKECRHGHTNTCCLCVCIYRNKIPGICKKKSRKEINIVNSALRNEFKLGYPSKKKPRCYLVKFFGKHVCRGAVPMNEEV